MVNWGLHLVTIAPRVFVPGWSPVDLTHPWWSPVDLTTYCLACVGWSRTDLTRPWWSPVDLTTWWSRNELTTAQCWSTWGDPALISPRPQLVHVGRSTVIHLCTSPSHLCLYVNHPVCTVRLTCVATGPDHFWICTFARAVCSNYLS